MARTKIIASGEDSEKPEVPVANEKQALLEAYKKSNPAKYAAKLASGEFDKWLAE